MCHLKHEVSFRKLKGGVGKAVRWFTMAINANARKTSVVQVDRSVLDKGRGSVQAAQCENIQNNELCNSVMKGSCQQHIWVRAANTLGMEAREKIPKLYFDSTLIRMSNASKVGNAKTQRDDAFQPFTSTERGCCKTRA